MSQYEAVIVEAPNRDFGFAQFGYQAATDLAHRNRTALISLGIPKLVRFDKIRHRSVANCTLLVFLYLRREPKVVAVPSHVRHQN
jgi:hypothetical protein